MPKSDKPNILVIWGDDIGIGTSAAIRTGSWATDTQHRPHRQGRHAVHRFLRRTVLHGGTLVLHHRSERYRTGLSKVGIPGAPIGMNGKDRDHRRLPQEPGLCDRPVRQEPSRRSQRMLPTNHGFDEFFGNLYHLNAEEEPELPDYPNEKDSRIQQ